MDYYASYYKCALQVNPCSYSQYRGEPVTDEDSYNEAILKKCKENDIRIVGLANHGDVDSSENLRKKLNENGIVVFPGFEIMSAEKIHMVCLFSEKKTISELNKYLGAMGLGNAVYGNETSSKTCLEIAEEIKKLGGFWYAAHITGDNGILKIGKMHNVWKNDMLVAAQIPDSKENIDPKYKNILNNTDPCYKRKCLPAFINACDIDRPEDLDRLNATTLIKMTEPTFENFIIGFKDPDSRIRLNTELEKGYQSCIKNIRIFGGYLDGLDIDFSDNLVTIIGGRGTGKSTIINLIRYALDLSPKDIEKKKEFEAMIDHNLGSSARIELYVSSNLQHGKQFKVIRRYKELPVVEDEFGKVSNLCIRDILPSIEIYGQNEIIDCVRNPVQINGVVKRLFSENVDLKSRIDQAYKELQKNSENLKKLEEENERKENEISDLPALEERLKYYQDAGLESKLELVTKLTTEESRFTEFLNKIPKQEPIWPKIDFSFDNSDDSILQLVELADEFNSAILDLRKKYEQSLLDLIESYNNIKNNWDRMRVTYDEEIKDSLKKIEGIRDKKSSEIISDYTNLLKQVQLSEPTQTQLKKQKLEIKDLQEARKSIIENCKKCWDEYIETTEKQLKQLNKNKFKKIVRLSVKYKQQKDKILDILYSINGIGERSLLGLSQYENFDVFTFAEDVRKGVEHVKQKYSLTTSISEKIVKTLTEKDLREIEELLLPDLFIIELYVNGEYKRMENLSKGQQCTAVLNVLLYDNKDPLIIDQPEDNLDNSFIAENLINTIRGNKIKRQYIFATHNANIPVFGDAELIIAMEEDDGKGKISNGGIGSVDRSCVKEKVIQILEGGEAAFKMREQKYGL